MLENINNKKTKIQLEFLEEARDILSKIKSQIIEIVNNSIDQQKIENVLRMLHNIKGGASLTEFVILSDYAHQLETVFKVLKLYQELPIIDLKFKDLLLQSLDCTHQIINFYHQGIKIDKNWLETEGNSSFNALWQKLVQLQNRTETAIIPANFKCVNKRRIAELFATEVKQSLALLESSIKEQTPGLCQQVLTVANEFSKLGEMLKLDNWKKLSDSVISFLELHPHLVTEISIDALKAWQQSQLLIIMGQESSISARLKVQPLSLSDKQLPSESFYFLPRVEPLALAAQLEEVEIHTNLRQTASTPPPTTSSESFESQGITVRIPLHQLDEISESLEELSIERYGMERSLERLQNLAKTLKRRVQFLEQSNAQLRFAYDTKTTSPSEETLLKENNGLDTLEMDRYDEVDALFQDVAETIVQIQEINPDLNTNLEDVLQAATKQKRSFKQMQAALTQARMRPLSEILSLFHRYLRDLSLEYDKNVELVLEGEETLVDRKILKALGDPLLHLLRNAFVHGIEETDIRRAHGKPAKGKIIIKACQRKDQVIITVNDDGGGIDIEKVRLRAIQDGLLTDKQLKLATTTDFINLIFEPGFSTADEVTSLSGHGIGLDVVRVNLEIVRGSVKVDSQPGLGTTFTIAVPLSLSLATVLLVESKSLLLAFPTDAVQEMIPYNTNSVFSISGNYVLDYKGLVIPLIKLSDWLEYKSNRRQESLEGEPETNGPSTLIFNEGQKSIGLQIDCYWGEHEVTIRQIESNISMPIGFKGCAVLKGRVVPVVNTTEMLQWLTSYGEISQTNKLPDNPSTSLISQLSLDQELKTQLPALPASKYKKCILVVDDSVSVRRFLAVVLEKAEYEVEQARDGQDALDKLNSQLSVDAIICDIEMPRMNGYEFLCSIKKIAKFNEVPIVMLTSRSGEKHQKIAFDLGASAYLSKPYNEQNLLKILQSLI